MIVVVVGGEVKFTGCSIVGRADVDREGFVVAERKVVDVEIHTPALMRHPSRGGDFATK